MAEPLSETRLRLRDYLPEPLDPGGKGFSEFLKVLDQPLEDYRKATQALLHSRWRKDASLAALQRLSELRDLPPLPDLADRQAWQDWIEAWEQVYQQGPNAQRVCRLVEIALRQGGAKQSDPPELRDHSGLDKFPLAPGSRLWSFESQERVVLIENPRDELTYQVTVKPLGSPLWLDNPFLETVFPELEFAEQATAFPALYDHSQARGILLAGAVPLHTVVSQSPRLSCPKTPGYVLARPTTISHQQPEPVGFPRPERVDDQSFVGGPDWNQRIEKWRSNKVPFHPAAVGRAAVGMSSVTDGQPRLARWKPFDSVPLPSGPGGYRHGLSIPPGGSHWSWLSPGSFLHRLAADESLKDGDGHLLKSRADLLTRQDLKAFDLKLTLRGTCPASLCLAQPKDPALCGLLRRVMDRLRPMGVAFFFFDSEGRRLHRE